VNNELENVFIGKTELGFGGIDCEFVGSAHLLPLLLNSVTIFFTIWSSGIDVFFLHISNPMSKYV